MENSKKISTNTIVTGAVLIALSFVGSMIKIPGTTIALDAMPGFFAALYLGPLMGGIVALLGHLLTALMSSFPLSLPLHLIIMLEMGVTAYAFGWIYKKSNAILAIIVGILLNGIISPLVLVPITSMMNLPLSGMAFFMAMALPLSIVGGANILLAYVIFKLIKK